MASASNNESVLEEIRAQVKSYHFPLDEVPRLNCHDPRAERLIQNEV